MTKIAVDLMGGDTPKAIEEGVLLAAMNFRI